MEGGPPARGDGGEGAGSGPSGGTSGGGLAAMNAGGVTNAHIQHHPPSHSGELATHADAGTAQALELLSTGAVISAAGVVSSAGQDDGGDISTTTPSAAIAGTMMNSGTNKRKRSNGGLTSSPGGGDGDDEDAERARGGPAYGFVKRACNECRQQKLKCNVVQDPYTDCWRCVKLGLHCRIDSNFKRVGKRSKHAEMEKEMERLRRQLRTAVDNGFVPDDDDDVDSPVQYAHSRNHSFLNSSDEAVSSLLHLKQGGAAYLIPRFKRELDGVRLTEEAVDQLIRLYFDAYHPFLPFLDPAQTPDQYYDQHPLLFWTMIAVASRRYAVDPNLLGLISSALPKLLWKTISEIPSTYFVVKALCLLCTWPFPISSTSMDPTHILVGIMMRIATGMGLHRPNHTQDFSRVSVELNREQIHDRVKTWAVCNIVSQSCATGYGQPASTLYDFTLAVRPGENGPFTLSPELEARLQIERLCDKVSKEMYSNAFDARGVHGDEHRASHARIFGREFTDISVSVLSRADLSPIVRLHLKAAGLHLRLSAFFDSSTTKNYLGDLMTLYRASCAFLDLVSQLDVHCEERPQGILPFATNYILQMVTAACFTLLKLLGSFFAQEIDFEHGRMLFHRTIGAIRSISIVSNDLPWRMAELMVQLWNGARVDARSERQAVGSGEEERYAPVDDSLQLKVRCRMSMSLVFDSIWRWREEFQAQGQSLDAAPKYPTAPQTLASAPGSGLLLDVKSPANAQAFQQQQQQHGTPTSQSASHRLHGMVLGGGSINDVPPSSSTTTSLHVLGAPRTADGIAQHSSSDLHNGHAVVDPVVSMSSVNGNGNGSGSGSGGNGNGSSLIGLGDASILNNYDVFDPLSWMFDGYIDFPFAGMYQAGGGVGGGGGVGSGGGGNMNGNVAAGGGMEAGVGG